MYPGKSQYPPHRALPSDTPAPGVTLEVYQESQYPLHRAVPLDCLLPERFFETRPRLNTLSPGTTFGRSCCGW